MAQLLLLTNALTASAEVLPALGLLAHHVRVLPAEPAALIDAPRADAVLVDARRELAVAKSLCRVLRATGIEAPLLAVLTEGGLGAVNAEWGLDDDVARAVQPPGCPECRNCSPPQSRTGSCSTSASAANAPGVWPSRT